MIYVGRILIQPETTDIPITLIGEYSAICYNSDTSNHKKNYKRGLNCLRSDHGRVLEYVQVYFIADGYSAKLIREIYTAIAGGPTRLQASTRYINYKNFDYVVPPTIQANNKAMAIYQDTMREISESLSLLETAYGIPKEDSSMLLPLGMESKMVMRTNLRHLIDMAKQRKCQRAFWEYRQFMKDLEDSLAFYSDEWKFLIKKEKIMRSKCEFLGYCPEERGCGRYKKGGEE